MMPGGGAWTSDARVAETYIPLKANPESAGKCAAIVWKDYETASSAPSAVLSREFECNLVVIGEGVPPHPEDEGEFVDRGKINACLEGIVRTIE
jgi:hypothetical protein